MRPSAASAAVVVCLLVWHLGSQQRGLVSGSGTSASANSLPESCSRKRYVYNSTWGIVSNGEKEYPQDSHCEWLITAGRKGQIINLKFHDMLTECAYDYLFVYDGNSYNSTLLGSFSGSTLPLPIYAKSGNMLLLLFSDTNYVQQGFKAEFSVTNCTFNCSYNGRCENNACICDDMWMGISCSIRRCPDSCGQSAGHGVCRRHPAPARCICTDGYSGQSCSLSVNDSAGNHWHLLAASGTGLVPRTGHAAAYLSLCDCLFVFGGFTLNEYLGDLVMYNFSTSEWKTLTPKGGKAPMPRYGHAMVAYGDSLWMYGGKLKSGMFSNELWRYDLSRSVWVKSRTRGSRRPPGLARHSLTLVDDYYLYLFGGSFEHGEFSSEMYRINLKEEPLFWERVYNVGGKEMDRRLVGHSTVYHSDSRSLIAYGGIAVDVAKFSKLSDKIHIFNIDTRYWSFVNYSKNDLDLHVPMERAFHSANVIGNYMIVYGGYTHLHSKEEICFDQKMYFYHLGCHVWINIKEFANDFPGDNNPSSQGSFSHASGVRNGNSLLIVGGYSGAVRGDLLAYTVPASISTQESITMNMTYLCQRHKSRESCKANPECGWCSSALGVGNDTCLDRAHNQHCKTEVDSQECPGICPLLPGCQACLAIGSGLHGAALKADSLSSMWRPCVWCVQKAQCLSQGSGVGICSQGNNSSMDVVGWWGSNATRILSLDECRFKDFRPGLTLLKYRHPPNWNQPDEVSIINSTTENFSFMPEFPGHREQEAKGEYIARFRGFIHPLGTKPKAEQHLRLFILTSHVRAVLRMSTNESEQFLEVVANHTSGSNLQRTGAHRPDDKSLFPDPSRGHKYLIDFDVRLTINADTLYGDHATIQLLWNGFPNFRKEFTFEYLEPFNEGHCSTYNNCLACIADSACGWCNLLSLCFERIPESTGNGICASHEQSQYLVTQSRDCVLCSNYIYCENCTAIAHCEWLVRDSHCVRRGRFSDAVSDLASCPVPCNVRYNCSSCLGDPGRCAWCEHTQECFLFSTYTSTYLYGMCREWVDEDHIIGQHRPLIGGQCRNCSFHYTCKECLTDLRCGWCGSVENPINGECIDGDFQGPFSGRCPIRNVHSSSDYKWSYSLCPDVEECLLGLHSCHPNATCTNTFESYNCTCKKGFRGDGHKSCVKTCDEKCVHGVCSEAPLYKCLCELGWTGPDCSVNCGCNNHSTCTKGPGKCDQCQNWTEGGHCERCKPGSYGNATTSQGCQKCNCNYHGNMSAGYCDMRTGICYCQDHTEGEHCERCQSSYYGNPKDGGYCFLHCGSRQVLTSVTQGGLGSQRGSATRSCLWILTVHPELQENLFLRDSATPSIELTIHAGMNIHCVRNYLYVYDGLPSFVSKDPHWDWQNKVLGAFCGARLNHSIIVEAKSGYLTVVYERGDPSQGFNSTYVVRWCAGGCPANRSCIQGWCQCLNGHAGVNCDLLICPNNCSYSQGQGKCIQEYNVCSCEQGFGDVDCSRKLNFYDISQSMLINPHLLAPNIEHLASKLPRFGHSLIVDSIGNLWLHGGYSLSVGPLGDMYKFDTHFHKLEKVTVSSRVETSHQPQNRYFHATVHVKRNQGEMYILGGLSKKEILGDFWKFSLHLKEWKEMMRPPQISAIVGHTLTAFDDRGLLLVGGFDVHSGFSEKTYEYNLNDEQWLVLNTTGSFPLGMYGHTAVYHPSTMSFYIFGGIIYKLDKLVMSNELYALHYHTKKWTVLPADKGPFYLASERFRYLHTAVSMDDYMVVLGGRSKNGNLTKSILVYSYSCNTWMDLTVEGKTIISSSYDPAIGQASIRLGNSIYVFGGFSGKLLGKLVKIDLPADLCMLFVSKQDCWQAPGCRFCLLHQTDQVNQTYCHSAKMPVPQSCTAPANGTLALLPISQHCSKELIENRNCEQYTSCAECLAAWPTYPNAKNVCQWCSTCEDSRCIPVSATCEEEKSCNYLKQVVRDSNNCVDHLCTASDCEKCRNLKSCIWTRQISRSRDIGRSMSTVSIKPIYDWNCFNKKIQMASNFPAVSVPPLSCPPRCSQLKDCRSCLESAGAEGGWHECRWSEALKQCLSPSYQPLLCVGGVCEQVIRGSPEQCPRNCSEFSQCSLCLAQPHCGWYAFTAPSMNGQGICLKGGLHGPEKDDPVGTAIKGTILNCKETGACIDSNITKWINVAPMEWAYLKCPPENECLNNHHTCNHKSEECVDLVEGYKCHCRAGYLKEGKFLCKPVCNQGCEYGTCVAPDTCECHFGYVGNNCSTQCHCNEHSNCAGVDQLDICLKCMNNTQGKQCERCKPSYVGDPRNGGECISCHTYCNGHAKLCVDPEHYNFTLQLLSSEGDFLNVTDRLEFLQEGPTSDAVCVLCQNNTHKDRCEECLPGFFRTTESLQESCRPCECHGHGNSCDPVTGEKCNCQNNTESEQCTQKGKNNQPCWKLQCSKCKESFLGNPTNGHQCYKQMFVDRDYCFDRSIQDSCLTPNPLMWGRTVFFVVHPKYMNVDIRVIVDVAQGGVDLYFSPKEDTFVVDTNKSSGIHKVSFDVKYNIDYLFEVQLRKKRSSRVFRSSEETLETTLNGTDKSPHYKVLERTASGLNTFVTITDPFEFFVIRNIQNRLVITLPQEVHDLRSTRFYMVLQGVGSVTENVTLGSLFFRQDQPRIDLFVFFSVFFSCFFLFLAVCVVVWKIKQAIDIRRVRQRQVAEMEHMASRPFARIMAIIDENRSDLLDLTLYSPVLHSKKSKAGKHLHARESPKIQNEDKFSVRPVAVEPTHDGIAAVGTLLVQLPGGSSAPVKLTLGSSLITMRIYPNTYSSIKACMRRRTSHHNT